MRMRKKPNLIPRMERCKAVAIENPEVLKGAWLDCYPGHTGIDIEIGCGKGGFTVETASANPNILFIAIEPVVEAIIVAMERAMDKSLENLRFLQCDAGDLPLFFSSGEIRRIYLNFCDPWPKSRDIKKRLTHSEYLKIYSEILAPKGEIHFKTDNCGLFAYSLRSFERNGYELIYIDQNLHESGPSDIMTDYESRFHCAGIAINKAVARKI